MNGAINWRYETAVNAQLKREGKPDAFKAFPRVWGRRIKETPLVIHCTEDEGTQLYLEVKVERREVGYFCTETFQRIPTESIERFMKKKKRCRQGTDKQIVLKDFRLDHIAEITVNRDTCESLRCGSSIKSICRIALQTLRKNWSQHENCNNHLLPLLAVVAAGARWQRQADSVRRRI